MAEFTDDSLKWLEDIDLTEHQFAAGDQAGSLPWSEPAVNQDFSWEISLAEGAATTTRFLQKLVSDVESNKKALLLQQEIIEAQATKLKVLDRVTDYLQELQVHLDKLRDMFKEVMPKIHPEWDLQSPALKAMFEEADAETENLVNQCLGSQQE